MAVGPTEGAGEPASDPASDPALAALVAQVRAASEAGRPLALRGGGTKGFYGEPLEGEPCELSAYRGIVAYEPTELVITARCGTPLAELEDALAEQRQMLGFEPPHHGEQATVGGCVAAGLAGPRRASAGGVRDFVLGARIIDGSGRLLGFGGQVMKNVAGYDVSRLLAGSLGVLGPIVEVSLKVLPRPGCERTLRLELGESEALDRFNAWGGQPLPLSATAWADGRAYLRLSGAQTAVDAACARIGGEPLDEAEARDYWLSVREQRHAFFGGDAPLWRVSVPSIAPALGLAGPTLIEWGGAQRWLRFDGAADALRRRAAELGGHATLFRGRIAGVAAFQAPSGALMRLHRELKHALDPRGIFNPGRMFAEL